MEGVLFDTKRLKRGLPVRWRVDYGGDRFGLISEVNVKSITILAVCGNKFKEAEYSIEEITDFELLGEWEKEEANEKSQC